MKARWDFTLASLDASFLSSLNVGKAGSGTILYSSSLFLLSSLVTVEVLGVTTAVALITVLKLEQLALAAGWSAIEVPLLDDNLHAASLLAKVASSVIVCVLVKSTEQLHKAKYI